MDKNTEDRLRQRAVALRYNPEEDIAPKILAKGAGIIAEKILESAVESEIYVHQDAALVEDLTKMDVGDSIPPELYDIIAQVLVFISDLDRQETAAAYKRGKQQIQPALI